MRCERTSAKSTPKNGPYWRQLRAGNVEQAVNWYAQHGRITTAPNRDQALDQTVSAWAKDIAEGKRVEHDGVAASQRRRPQHPGPTSHASGGEA